MTPNQITVTAMAVGLLGALCFAAGRDGWAVTGALLLIASYALDNCDGDIARIKDLCSEFGAKLDDLADWLVDSAFFLALGVGTASTTGHSIWLWYGVAAAAGATIDYVVDRIIDARDANAPVARSREEQGRAPKQPQDLTDWLIYVLHKLTRADFPFIILALALFHVTWVLLPLGAVGAQAYWVTDLFKRARGWHT